MYTFSEQDGILDTNIEVEEVNAKFINEGDNVYCFHDLNSAFDTVEFCMLLEELFSCREWRESTGDSFNICTVTSSVKWNWNTWYQIKVSWGFRQGCVLSPTIFNLVMDHSETKTLGLKCKWPLPWGFAHADDIWISAANIEDAAFSKSSLLVLSPSPGTFVYSCQVRSKSLHLKLMRPASQLYHQ